MKREESSKALTNVLNSMRAEDLLQFGYVKDSEELMLKVVEEMLDVLGTNMEYKERTERERKVCFLVVAFERLHREYVRDVKEIVDGRSCH